MTDSHSHVHRAEHGTLDIYSPNSREDNYNFCYDALPLAFRRVYSDNPDEFHLVYPPASPTSEPSQSSQESSQGSNDSILNDIEQLLRARPADTTGNHRDNLAESIAPEISVTSYPPHVFIKPFNHALEHSLPHTLPSIFLPSTLLEAHASLGGRWLTSPSSTPASQRISSPRQLTSPLENSSRSSPRSPFENIFSDLIRYPLSSPPPASRRIGTASPSPISRSDPHPNSDQDTQITYTPCFLPTTTTPTRSRFSSSKSPLSSPLTPMSEEIEPLSTLPPKFKMKIKPDATDSSTSTRKRKSQNDLPDSSVPVMKRTRCSIRQLLRETRVQDTASEPFLSPPRIRRESRQKSSKEAPNTVQYELVDGDQPAAVMESSVRSTLNAPAADTLDECASSSSSSLSPDPEDPLDPSSSSRHFSRRAFSQTIPNEISPELQLFYRRFPASSYFKLHDADPPTKLLNKAHPGGTYNPPKGPFDLYTPRFVKGKGREKMGLCPICIESIERGGEGKAVWLAMKFSAYKCYHMQYMHGISASSSLPFFPPLAFRVSKRPRVQKSEKSTITEGKCHQCRKWIPVEGVKDVEVKVKEIFWWKHAAACHRSQVSREDIAAAIDDSIEKDEVFRRLREFEVEMEAEVDPGSDPC
ncbi:hypothetical protein Moror_16180 [Moniliophthora roreri MCA 2997]|uniref:Transcription regulator Rua1 C-terminal domain-containing protein n=1 Tax=Moniliophthora roreri (strain MCA 2997) TaxID=1381753 RepID=V2XA87_MONRO|nr:hypothetical protein Moror_16180 [Moniliophthora roreri MCA 2997]